MLGKCPRYEDYLPYYFLDQKCCRVMIFVFLQHVIVRTFGVGVEVHGLVENQIVNGEKCGELVSAGRNRW